MLLCWLYSGDGSISDTEQAQNKLQLELSEIDKSLLEKLKINLGLTNPLYRRKEKILQVGNKIYIGKPTNILKVYSNKICKDLENSWNIVPRKTNVLLPPNINNEDFIKAYLVGFIDADGSIIEVKNRNHFKVSIIGNSEIFLNWCKFQLSKLGNIIECPNIHKRNKSYICQYDADKAREIIKSLWQVDVPRLKRKWDKVSHLKGF